MKIERAELRDEGLLLHVPRQEARAWLYRFKPGSYEIKAETQKRSLDANAFAWALIGKIAQAVSLPKDTIYIDAIEAVGVYDTLYCTPEAYESFAQRWSKRGLGWFAQKADEEAGMCLVLAHYGSSAYTKQEMSALIDYLVDEAHMFDIQTEDDERIAALVEAWE